jgi:N-methylhydantoinase A
MARPSVGVDIGGTFTDFISVDPETGAYRVVKTPSVPESPERAVGDALAESGLSEVNRVSHGTTVVTNAILERTGAPTALVTTDGFQDSLVIDRQDRDDIYDLQYDRGTPLVPRHRCFGVTERVGPDGEVVEPLDAQAVDDVAAVVAASDAESVAVCFLHSYANDVHEREAAELLRERLDVPVSRSSAVLPEFREYERTNTTALNAYTRPNAETYLDRLRDEVDDHCDADEILVMRSDGGVLPVEEAADLPVYLGVSGPAAGVVAATNAAARIGVDDVLTFDMGGTSADMSLVRDGRPEITTEGEIGEESVSVPMYDIRTIGAGGGSVSYLDEGGLLKVGPRSAGAKPGPACYGRGGTEPTVTDANLLLGLMDPDAELGEGTISLDVDAAEEVVEELADELGRTPIETAHSVYELVNMNMVENARVISVQQGIDPRTFSLVAFGGAGPLHAPYIARELDMPRVVVPPRPGILSAIGLLHSDVRRTASRTVLRSLEGVDAEEVASVFESLESEVRRGLSTPSDASTEWTVDVRFAGQAYELRIPISRDLSGETLEELADRFRRRHREKYGFVMESPLELVTFRVALVAPTDVPPVDWTVESEPSPTTREVYLDGAFHEASVFQRDSVDVGFATDGPALIEMADSTVVVLPDQQARVDEAHNVVVETSGGETDV